MTSHARTLMDKLVSFPTVSRDSNLELIDFVEGYLVLIYYKRLIVRMLLEITCFLSPYLVEFGSKIELFYWEFNITIFAFVLVACAKW